MNEIERKRIMVLADTIKGEINRMCLTHSLEELDYMYKYAKSNLDRLAKMIYEARFAAVRPQKGEGSQ